MLRKRGIIPLPRSGPSFVMVLLGFGFVVALPSLLALQGCSEEKPSRVLDVLPDTTWLKVFAVKYLAVNDSAQYRSGVEWYWREYFYSNRGKSCRITEYLILDPHEDTIFHRYPRSLVITSGDTNYAKTKWLDVADPQVAGLYALRIAYHHSNKDFVFDTTIEVIANMFDGPGR